MALPKLGADFTLSTHGRELTGRLGIGRTSWRPLHPISNEATRKYTVGVRTNSDRSVGIRNLRLAQRCEKPCTGFASDPNCSGLSAILPSSSAHTFMYCSSEALTSLSETRQTTLLNAFLTALTRGGSSGLPRPIEIHAHDPMRYVGDMLAWVHQAIAAEHEFLVSLFGLKHDGRMVGSVRVPGTSEEEEWIRELMDLAIGKLCVPLKVGKKQACVIRYYC
jgi:hypothetical protein